MDTINKKNILYIFGGEKAQGAEIVIERLMLHNLECVNAELILSPGEFASELLNANKPYNIFLLNDLKKLNRSSSSKINYYSKALKNYFSVSYRVYKYLKGKNIQIIHVNTMVPASYLIPLVLYSRVFLKSIKWLWSDHDLKYFSGLDTMLSKTCVKVYDRTLVVSEAVKKKYTLSNNKVMVLYNGLDMEYFKSDKNDRLAFRSSYNLSPDLIVIGMVANINPDKGQLTLINLFSQISSKYSNIRLFFAGDFASQFPEYAEEVKLAINLDEKIIHTGFLKSIKEFYNGCDIIINNSNNYRSESLGTSIYEAMACEKIVVASDTGGNPEIISNDVDGFLFETENEVDMENKLTSIIDNYQDLNQIKRAAREKVRQKFDITAMVKKYNLIINDV